MSRDVTYPNGVREAIYPSGIRVLSRIMQDDESKRERVIRLTVINASGEVTAVVESTGIYRHGSTPEEVHSSGEPRPLPMEMALNVKDAFPRITKRKPAPTNEGGPVVSP